MSQVSEGQRHYFAEGQVLMARGEHENFAWLILSGQLEISAEDKTGKIMRRPPASYEMVGEMALIEDSVRATTATAASDVVAIQITRAMIPKFLAQATPLGRYLLTSLILAIRYARGHKIQGPLTEGVDIRSSDQFGRILERRAFAADTRIFAQGDRGESAYLIQSGQVRIERDHVELEVIGAGRIFGEMALVRNAPRSASAIAVGATTVEVIKRPDFERALDAMPGALRALVKALVEQLSRRPTRPSGLSPSAPPGG